MKIFKEKENEHFPPCPSETVEIFKFQKRLRKQGEKIVNFIRELCQLSEFCNLGNTLNAHMYDQLVFGIQDERIQQKLLNHKNFLFQITLEIKE